MDIKVLYDNIARNGFLAGWGFSCLVETSDTNILFDAGWDGNVLLHNMKIANIRPETIDKIFISHSHWDHIGGINHILKYEKISEVYLPESVSNNLKNEIKRYSEVIEISGPKNICDNIWTTGELGDEIKEHSMVIKADMGNLVLTGCAHPGLDNIIRKSRELGDVHTVIGGFHDSDIDILQEIPRVIPGHCTKRIKEIKEKMPASYESCVVGFNLHI